MGNYKYLQDIIAKMVNKKKPFIIIKYGITDFNGQANNVYELVTLGRKNLQYVLLDRHIALGAIRKYNLPQLHKMDNRNVIWGDERFKDKFHNMGLKL